MLWYLIKHRGNFTFTHELSVQCLLSMNKSLHPTSEFSLVKLFSPYILFSFTCNESMIDT
jgi:hypothetical protein